MAIYTDQREYAKAEYAALLDQRASPNLNSVAGASKASLDRTALDDVHGAMSEARNLANRIMSLVDRLCGTTAQECGKVVDADYCGVFPQLRNASGETLELVRQAQSALNRLDRELP